MHQPPADIRYMQTSAGPAAFLNSPEMITSSSNIPKHSFTVAASSMLPVLGGQDQ